MTELISPAYPGKVLSSGSSGSEVARVQEYLNALRVQYPQLRRLSVDGKFGANSKTAVMQYQALRGLAADGAVGAMTWNALIGQYNGMFGGSADTYPGIALRSGSHSQDVSHMQQSLNAVSALYTAVGTQSVDAAYGAAMTNCVRRFQRQFELSNDGVLGQRTWNRIVSVRTALENGTRPTVSTPYSGTVLQMGASGDDVRYVQSYLNRILPAALAVDGRYGSATRNAAVLFQAQHGLSADGKVGGATWAQLIPAFNESL